MQVPIILAILGLSWLLLHFTLRENLHTLGIKPVGKRLLQLFGCLFTGGLITLIIIAMDTWIYGTSWIHVSFTPAEKYLRVFMFQLGQVITIELLFRGALLVLLLRYIKYPAAIIISAVAYAAYKVIPFDPENIFWFMFIQNGLEGLLFGLVFAYAFYRSGTILTPTGLHLGWEYVYALFYSALPAGRLLFSVNPLAQTAGQDISYELHFIIMCGRILLAAALMFLAVRLFLNKPKQVIYIDA